jgi:DNA-binding CsgD family transcriptional regulator/tetratricopeptide (TPR) repeat protein
MAGSHRQQAAGERPVLIIPSPTEPREAMMEDVPATPLIGRSAELEHLGALIGLGTSEQAPVAVLVGGDAGVGKTRLIAELIGGLTRSGCQASVGHCMDLGDSPLPYLPFTQILGRLSSESPAQAEALVHRRPALRRLMPATGSGAEEGRQLTATDRSNLFEAVAAIFDHLGASQRLLWVVEDVHWADRSTREMITYLLSHPPTSPATLLVTYRLDDLHRRHPLRPVLREWGRLPRVERITVPPLDEVEVRGMVRALQRSPLSEADVATIVSRAEGNPFFVEELVGATRDGSRSLPADLSDLLLIRVDSLDETARQVVKAASVAGREVSHRLLATVVGVDEASLEAALHAAVDAKVIVATSGDRYSFRHALLSEAVYSDLLPGERVRLHAAYANALAEDPASGTAADLARHARGARDPVTAARASVLAGDEASTLAAPDEALSQYEAAIGILAEIGPATAETTGIDPIEVTVRASNAAIAAGQPIRALGLIEDHLAGLEGFSPPQARARLLRALAGTALVVDSGLDVRAIASEALSLVPADPPSALRAELVGILARAHLDFHRHDAIPLATEALDLARQLNLPEVAVGAATTLARLQQGDEDLEVSAMHLAEAAAEARTAGEHDAELRALYSVGSVNFEAGRMAEALAAYQQTLARAEELRLPWTPFGIVARAMVAIVYYMRGDWPEVERITCTAGESSPEFPEMLLRAVGLGVLAARGDGAGLETLASLRPYADKDGLIAILVGAAAIDIYGDRGDIAGAVKAHDQTVAAVTRLWRVPTFDARRRLSALLIGQLATDAALTPGESRKDLVEAGSVLADAAEEAARYSRSMQRYIGPEAHAWAQRAAAEHVRLRWQSGVNIPSPGEMVDAWRAAADRFEQLGHRFETARSKARLAAALHAAGHEKDAADMRAEVEAAARLMGAQPLLRELGSPPDAAVDPNARGGQPLTVRELEVLRLVSIGRSNRQIADQLYISAKTASVHVSNILSKLGARSRTEAVAIAHHRGVIQADMTS